jgi:hypothetical protein
MTKHYVKVNSWLDGVLSAEETLVSTWEDAMAHLTRHHEHHSAHSDSHSIKIYTIDGELVHELNSSANDSTSYA